MEWWWWERGGVVMVVCGGGGERFIGLIYIEQPRSNHELMGQ